MDNKKIVELSYITWIYITLNWLISQRIQERKTLIAFALLQQRAEQFVSGAGSYQSYHTSQLRERSCVLHNVQLVHRTLQLDSVLFSCSNHLLARYEHGCTMDNINHFEGHGSKPSQANACMLLHVIPDLTMGMHAAHLRCVFVRLHTCRIGRPQGAYAC